VLDWPFLWLNFGMIAPILHQRDRVPKRCAAKLVNAAVSAVPNVRRERHRPVSAWETRYPVFQIVWRLKAPRERSGPQPTGQQKPNGVKKRRGPNRAVTHGGNLQILTRGI
jgi:hypothetical protein